MRKLLLVALVLSFALIEVRGQVRTRKLENVKVTNTKAVFLGKTKRVDELIKLDKISPEKKARNKSFKRKYLNFKNEPKNNAVILELEHQGEDPVRQRTFDRSSRNASPPIINVDGVSNVNGAPNDPSGAIGRNHYVQAVNSTTIRVINKEDGTTAGEFNGNSLWAPLGENSAGDPIILYDSELDQWIITEFTTQGINTLLIGVSEDSDPFGSYSVYSFAAPNFPDYPKYGIWSDFLVVTTNEFQIGETQTRTTELHQYFIDRAALMSGANQDDVNIQRVAVEGHNAADLDSPFILTTPVNWIGGPAPIDNRPVTLRLNDSSWGEVDADSYEVYTFDINFENPSKTQILNTTLIATPYDPFPCSDDNPNFFECIQQPGTNLGLNGLTQVIMNVPQYRNFGTHESIVMSFTTDATNGENVSGIRWAELRRTEGNDWSIYQEGTFAPNDGLHRWMPTSALDAEGNIAIAYSVTGGENEFPGIRYTGRLEGDPLGQMTSGEQIAVRGVNPIFFNATTPRFGDYSHMSVDPIDGRTFWSTSEYGGNPPSFAATRVFSFQLERFQNDLIAGSILTPSSTSLNDSESVTALIRNSGLLSADNFTVELLLDGVSVSTFTNTTPLVAESDLEITFESTLDLSEVRDYELTISVTFDADENLGNNSSTTIVSNLATSDISTELFFPASMYCTNEADGTITITNEGIDELTSAVIEVNVNGSVQETINWAGSLQRSESETISITAEGLIEGNNTVDIVANQPNGRNDGNFDDNSSDATIVNDPNLTEVSVVFQTDRFPQEISWRIADADGNIVFRGEPIGSQLAEVEVNRLVCLDPTLCYSFTIVDSQRDGICCGFGNGSYSLLDEAGETIFESNGEFGVSETTDFCIGDCNLMVEVDVSNVVGNQLGSILLTATGGNAIEYSIDGGQNFQSESLFEGLEAGDYEVVVRSNNGDCIFEETITINTVVSTRASLEQGITIFPNPTDGLFQLSVKDNENIEGFLNVKVIDINGKIIQDLRFSKYDDTFEGSISLVAFPDGIYFVKLANMEEADLLRVIKQ